MSDDMHYGSGAAPAPNCQKSAPDPPDPPGGSAETKLRRRRAGLTHSIRSAFESWPTDQRAAFFDCVDAARDDLFDRFERSRAGAG